MKRLNFLEVFGHWVGNSAADARKDQKDKNCGFTEGPCHKISKSNPIGICSFGSPEGLVTVCPSRFRQNNQIFKDAGTIAFGKDKEVAIHPEFRLIKLEDGTRIGKIDFLLSSLDKNGKILDFAALEVQSVYISGNSIKSNFQNFMETGLLPEIPISRPDWRSSIQKRLMPQLSLKVPVFRRWAKKFFVVVDAQFFAEIPKFKTVSSAGNSEVIWLVYPFHFEKNKSDFIMGTPKVIYSQWDDVQTALKEGTVPEPSEVLEELQANVEKCAHVRSE
jgi:hypothetical protein